MEITSVIGNLQSAQQTDRNAAAKARSVVNNIISGGVRKADEVVAQQTTATKLQASETGFKQASASLARVSTLAQTAGDGIEQIRGELEKFRAGGGGDAGGIKAAIDRAAEKTTFEGKVLFDGSVKISLEETLSGVGGSKDDITLSLPKLSSKELVGDKPTAETLDRAVAVVDKTLSEVNDFKKSVDVVAASIDTVAANQLAAQSDLRESDLDGTALRDVQKNPQKAIAAQGNQLNPALVKLVS